MTEPNDTSKRGVFADSAPEESSTPGAKPLFSPEAIEHIAPTDQAQRDDDLTTLLRNDHVYRSIMIGPKCVLTLRDIKTRQFLSARRMAQYVDTKQTMQHDSISSMKYELALSIVSYKIDEVEVPMASLESDNKDEALKAFSDRLEMIDGWPLSLWSRAIEAFRVLMEYINQISSPESLVDF